MIAIRPNIAKVVRVWILLDREMIYTMGPKRLVQLNQ